MASLHLHDTEEWQFFKHNWQVSPSLKWAWFGFPRVIINGLGLELSLCFWPRIRKFVGPTGRWDSWWSGMLGFQRRLLARRRWCRCCSQLCQGCVTCSRPSVVAPGDAAGCMLGVARGGCGRRFDFVKWLCGALWKGVELCGSWTSRSTPLALEPRGPATCSGWPHLWWSAWALGSPCLSCSLRSATSLFVAGLVRWTPSGN